MTRHYVVIHRRRHPLDGTRRWFTVEGRDFGLIYEGPGWGYRVFDIITATDVADSLHTLDEVRTAVAHPRFFADWLSDHHRAVACKLGVCLSCGAATDGRYYLCQSCDDGEAVERHTARVSERATDDGSRSAEPRSART